MDVNISDEPLPISEAVDFDDFIVDLFDTLEEAIIYVRQNFSSDTTDMKQDVLF